MDYTITYTVTTLIIGDFSIGYFDLDLKCVINSDESRGNLGVQSVITVVVCAVPVEKD